MCHKKAKIMINRAISNTEYSPFFIGYYLIIIYNEHKEGSKCNSLTLSTVLSTCHPLI
ncbi:hypothetical protein [Desulfothermus naphthae]